MEKIQIAFKGDFADHLATKARNGHTPVLHVKRAFSRFGDALQHSPIGKCVQILAFKCAR
jgi:hypothetical protein